MTQQGKKGRGTPLAQEGHQPDAQCRRGVYLWRGVVNSSKRCQVLGISQDCQEWQGHLSESKEARAKMPKYGSPSGKVTWNEKRSSCGSGCKTLWLIKVYVTRVSRHLAELKWKNAHTVHTENGHKSLSSQRRKKLFLPLAMREPTPNQLASLQFWPINNQADYPSASRKLKRC